MPVTTRMTWTIFRLGDLELNLHLPQLNWDNPKSIRQRYNQLETSAILIHLHFLTECFFNICHPVSRFLPVPNWIPSHPSLLSLAKFPRGRTNHADRSWTKADIWQLWFMGRTYSTHHLASFWEKTQASRACFGIDPTGKHKMSTTVETNRKQATCVELQRIHRQCSWKSVSSRNVSLSPCLMLNPSRRLCQTFLHPGPQQTFRIASPTSGGAP